MDERLKIQEEINLVGLIEIIAGIQIVLAADLKPNLFIPGSAFPNKSSKDQQGR